MFLGVWAFLGVFSGGVSWAPADMASGVFGRPFAVLRGVREDVAAGTLSEGGKSGGKVDRQSLTEHVGGFPHYPRKLLSWVGQEDGEGACSLGGVGECGFSPYWGFDDGAGPVLEVLTKLGLEFGGGWKVAVGMAVNGDILKSNSSLSLIRDEGEDIFPEGAEDRLLVLSYESDSRVACEGQRKIRGERGPPPPC